MRKIVTMFLLIVSLGLVFAGAATAQVQPTVDVLVLNQDGAPVDVTYPGSEVKVQVNAKAHLTRIQEPFVNITVNPENGLILKPENAVMYFNHDDQQYGPFTNNPKDPFFFWSDEWQSWVWYVGWYGGAMYMTDYAQLSVPATVTEMGIMTVKTDFYGWPWEGSLEDPPILQDTNRYSFPSVLFQPNEPEQPGITPWSHPPCTGETVPMQATGSPLAVAALGLLSIIGGVVYGKLR